jgi:hypothetical protein
MRVAVEAHRRAIHPPLRPAVRRTPTETQQQVAPTSIRIDDWPLRKD